MKNKLNHPYYFYLFVVLVAIYAVLVLALPVDHRLLVYYNLSILSLRLIELTYLIPEIIIWSLAYFGFSKILNYSKTIGTYKDGKQMKKLAIGIGIFAFGGPLVADITSILNAIAQKHLHLIPTSTIVGNYLSAAMALSAFLFLAYGARGLVDSIKWRPPYKAIQLFGIIYVVIAAFFSYLIFHKLPNSLSLGITAKPQYYLPDWLLLTTLVIPYLYLWFIGGMAVLYIRAYRQKIKGLIYKRSLYSLEIGFSILIASHVILQYLTIISSKLITLKLVPLLSIIYPLLIVEALGYIFIAFGAMQLQKIEEI